MIIDIHAHPVLLDVINEDPEDLSFRKHHRNRSYRVR